MRWYSNDIQTKEAAGPVQRLRNRAALMDEILALLGPDISIDTLEAVRDELKGVQAPEEAQWPRGPRGWPNRRQRQERVRQRPARHEQGEGLTQAPGEEAVQAPRAKWDPIQPEQKRTEASSLSEAQMDENFQESFVAFRNMVEDQINKAVGRMADGDTEGMQIYLDQAQRIIYTMIQLVKQQERHSGKEDKGDAGEMFPWIER